MNAVEDILNLCYREGVFLTQEGKIISNWFDKNFILSNPHMITEISNAMRIIMPCEIDVLVPVPIGAIPIATKLSLDTNIPMALVNRDKKNFGLSKKIEGANVSGMRVLIIEDVTYTGSSILNITTILKSHEAKVVGAMSILNRNGREIFFINDVCCEGLSFEIDNSLRLNKKIQKI